MNTLVLAWKYMHGRRGMHEWEKRSPLAAAMLRTAASLGFWLAVASVLFYPFVQSLFFTMNYWWAWGYAGAFIGLTRATFLHWKSLAKEG